MNEQDRSDTGRGDILRGSAWAALDETFFRIVQSVFSHDFCFGATAMLAMNDSDMDVENVPADDMEAARRAAMRRHPRNFRRF
jgi:hypothetical protein